MSLKPEQLPQVLQALKGISLFAGCPESVLQALAEQIELARVAKGKVILMEQEISRVLYILVKGKVGIWRRESGEKKLIATLEPNDFFGEFSMFTEVPANALVKVEEDCELLKLSRDGFNAVADNNPTLRDTIVGQVEKLKTQRPAPLRIDSPQD